MSFSNETRFQLLNLYAHICNKAEEESMRVRRKYDTTTAMKIDCIQRGAFNSCINTIQNLIEADNINKKREAKIKKQKAVKKKPVKKKLVVQVTDRFSDLEH